MTNDLHEMSKNMMIDPLAAVGSALGMPIARDENGVAVGVDWDAVRANGPVSPTDHAEQAMQLLEQASLLGFGNINRPVLYAEANVHATLAVLAQLSKPVPRRAQALPVIGAENPVGDWDGVA